MMVFGGFALFYRSLVDWVLQCSYAQLFIVIMLRKCINTSRLVITTNYNEYCNKEPKYILEIDVTYNDH